MKQLHATYQINTPMFLGNQEGICDDNIRPTSFKGMLRFWWRALNWSKCWVDAVQNEKEALKRLHQREGKLFGLDADQRGQGLFLLSLTNHYPGNEKKYHTIDYQTISGQHGSFLAYGMQGNPNRAQPSRNAIKPEQTFSVTLLAKPKATQTDIESIEDALTLMGLMGSLGAKARNGFGSLTLTKLNNEAFEIESLDDFTTQLQNLLKKYPIQQVQTLPPYTAFSSHTRLVKKKNSLKELNNHYKQFAEENDSNRAKKFLGQPRKNPQGQNIYGSMQERRASPLLMHILKTADKQTHALILFLPAQWKHGENTTVENYKTIYQWLSEGQSISLKGGQNA